MIRKTRSMALCVAVWAVLWGTPTPASAEVPALLPVQGHLTEDDGTPVDGEVSIKFTLYDAETGGGVLFAESQMVLVRAGYFTVYLGDSKTLDLGIFRNNEDIWIATAVGTGPEMTPRMLLGTVPFAAHAQHASEAGSVPWSGVTDVPEGIAEAESYSAGSGLELSEGTFRVDTSEVQSRVSSTCPAGEAIRAIDATGGVTCQPVGDIGEVNAGTGLMGGGSSGSVTVSADTGYLQRRVTGACPGGSAIQSIDSTGAVTCESVGSGGGGGGARGSYSDYTSTTMTSGVNYIYPSGSSYSPSVGGVCLVNMDLEFPTSAAGSGPFTRVAVKTDGSDGHDGKFGFYPSETDRMVSRSATVDVSAGSSYQFGCYLGYPPESWQGNTVRCRVSWLCF